VKPLGVQVLIPQNGVKDALGCHKWRIEPAKKSFGSDSWMFLGKIVVSCSFKPPEGCGFDQREVGTIG
jgi:hypothetical protein